MPVGPGRFRVVTTKSGAKVRLHFTKGGRVNEAKNLGSGATHTPAEFAKDRKMRRSARGSTTGSASEYRLGYRRASGGP